MKNKLFFLLGALAVFSTSCNNNNQSEQIVSQTYMHKHGYAISKAEWESQNFPGQVITTLRDGVTVCATYEDGVLHGATSHTYPHSQTIESYFVYDRGNLTKETYYDSLGMPVKEIVHVSPVMQTTTFWYKTGAPLSIEEHVNNELITGQYFNAKNEVESRVVKGNGLRLVRDNQGTLKAKDEIKGGYLLKRETFYPSGTPESIINYVKGLEHGTKKMFAASGEPLAIEQWQNGQLHGTATYFRNGAKFLECDFSEGTKTGFELHFVNGDKVVEKTMWVNDKKHGPSYFYIDGSTFISWFYDDKEVSQKKYQELNALDEKIISMREDFDLRDAR